MLGPISLTECMNPQVIRDRRAVGLLGVSLDDRNVNERLVGRDNAGPC